MEFVVELLYTETFWYVLTLFICFVAVVYVFTRPVIKAKKMREWDD